MEYDIETKMYISFMLGFESSVICLQSNNCPYNSDEEV